jgi:IMP dehydrogenase
MARIIEDISRTFAEYLLLPRLTPRNLRTDTISLAAPVAAKTMEDSHFSINIPVVSACMQSVSGTRLAISLARQGGLSMIYCSQSVEAQVAMVREVKAHKAGFVTSGANTTPSSTLASIVDTMHRTGHSTIPVTEDGTANGVFCGLITDQDFWEFEDDLNNLVERHMTPKSDVIFGEEGISLREANQLLHRHKKRLPTDLGCEGATERVGLQKGLCRSSEKSKRIVRRAEKAMRGRGHQHARL